MNIADVQTAMAMAPVATEGVTRLGGPLGVVGRVIGMGAEEVEAGVPTWAWTLLGVAAGAAVGYFLRPRFDAMMTANFTERPQLIRPAKWRRRRHRG